MNSLRYLFCLCFVLSASQSSAQVTPRNLLGSAYSPETIRASLIERKKWQPYPKTVSDWKRALPDTVRTQLIQAGEAAAKLAFEPLPATLMLEYVRTGDRNHYQEISYGKRSNLVYLALAESIEGKGRFTDAITDGIWSICEESYWGVPAHLGLQKAGSGLPDLEDPTVDLFSAETAAMLALTDYLVGDRLDSISPLTRRRIYLETNRRIFEPLQHLPDRYHYLKRDAKVNNWNPWIMSNWITAAALLEPDQNRRANMLHTAMLGIDLYLNGLGNDGGCDEGPSYWFAAGGGVFDALELLQSATGGKIDLYQDRLIYNMASYIYKMHISSDYFVNFADANPKHHPDGLMLYRFGKKIQNDTLMHFGQWAYHTFGRQPVYSPETPLKRISHVHRRLSNLLAIGSMPVSSVSFTGVRNAWFPDIQVMTARSGKGLFIATHGGHNDESHNHNDVGDFILYADGQPVVIDVGRGTYTSKTFSPRRYELWYTQSQYHNVPVINGFGQPAGRLYSARNVACRSAGERVSLQMDIAAAYPKEAGVRSWNRTVTLSQSEELVEIIDEHQLEHKPASLQQSFMTVCQVDISVPGRITFELPNNRRVLLHYEARHWRVAVKNIPLVTQDDESFKTKWSGKPIQRILFTRQSPMAKGKTSFTFAYH